MFGTWKAEKAITALVDEAQDMADKLASAKPHFVDSHAAEAQFWVVSHRADGVDLTGVATWKPAALARFIKASEGKIAALRKAREYSRSDGLAIWLHTARAVTEPRILPPVRAIWQRLTEAGPNAVGLAEDMLTDAGLPPEGRLQVPAGFEPQS